MISATPRRLAMTSMYLEASSMAMITARAVLGYWRENSAVVPRTFSG